MRSHSKVADVLEMEQDYISSRAFTSWHRRTLHAIRRCRTPAMGGHIDKCDCCDKLHISYNSCRNRHCPTCQGHKREQWIQARESELLNVPYFHVVFTLPSELNAFALSHPKIIYGSLFKAAWATLRQFGENPKHLGGQMGMIAILHLGPKPEPAPALVLYSCWRCGKQVRQMETCKEQGKIPVQREIDG